MSGEPELHPETSDQWVTYLKQLMQHYGLWNGDTEPEFTDELATAVRSLQATYSISPADGVVRADTWAVLTGETNSSQAPEQQPAEHQPAQQHDQQPAGEHHGMQANPNAHATETPATFSEHGLPAFEFTLPEIPIAEADFETPEASVHVELSLTGKVKVTFPHHVEGATVGNEGLEVEAGHAVDHLNQGIQIGGIGSETMTIADTVSSQYAQSTYGLDSSGAMVFTGTVHVHYDAPTNDGNAEVEGEVGYSVKIHVIPHPQQQEEELEPVHDESTWFERHRTLVEVGVVVLFVAVAIGTAGAAIPVEAEAGAAGGSALLGEEALGGGALAF